jgi:hypothetical protein
MRMSQSFPNMFDGLCSGGRLLRIQLLSAVERPSLRFNDSRKYSTVLDPFFETAARFLAGNYFGEVNGAGAGRVRSTLGKTHRR